MPVIRHNGLRKLEVCIVKNYALTLLSTFILVFLPQVAAAEIKALVSYADWCGPCQILQPKLHGAASEFGDNITIQYLDFTDMSAENLYRQFTDAAPLQPADFLVDGEFLRTGFAYILDGDEVVNEVFSTMSQEEITAILARACRESC